MNIISLIDDEELKAIIVNNTNCQDTIVKALRTTLYSLIYKPYSVTTDITRDELLKINTYKNKPEFNNLFKMIITKSYSIQDMCFKSVGYDLSF